MLSNEEVVDDRLSTEEEGLSDDDWTSSASSPEEEEEDEDEDPLEVIEHVMDDMMELLPSIELTLLVHHQQQTTRSDEDSGVKVDREPGAHGESEALAPASSVLPLSNVRPAAKSKQAQQIESELTHGTLLGKLDQIVDSRQPERHENSTRQLVNDRNSSVAIWGVPAPLPNAYPENVFPVQQYSVQCHHQVAPSSESPVLQQAARYICDICNKVFTRPSSLRIHSHSHTGERPFKCPHTGCGKAFSVLSNYKRHEQACHG